MEAISTDTLQETWTIRYTRSILRTYFWVLSGVANIPLSFATLVVYIKSDSIPGINTSRTVDILWQYQSLELSKAMEGVDQVTLEGVCLKVYDDSSMCLRKVWTRVLQRAVLEIQPQDGAFPIQAAAGSQR